MATQDVIEVVLASPIDWEKYERLVVEILRNDDIPAIRKLGGRGDHGVDAIQESFYQNERRLDVVIQITSQKAQRAKVADTLKKLSQFQIIPKRLVIVFRDPCAVTTRQGIREQGAASNLEIEVRDQHYLITELGRDGSTLFSRYFSGSIRQQVDQLLGNADPLGITDNSFRHAVLASLGAYALSRPGRLVRGKLFERTVLAILTVRSGGESIEELHKELHKQLPEQNFEIGQTRAALEQLLHEGFCELKDAVYNPTAKALAAVGKTSANAAAAFQDLCDFVTNHVKEVEQITDAQSGYIERNLKRALSLLIRSAGPSTLANNSERFGQISGDLLLRELGNDVSESIARGTLIALENYVRDSARRMKLVPLMRSYVILALRNLDPVGRRWQANEIGRSVLMLDTDAVLRLLVRELPGNAILVRALLAFSGDGVKIVIANSVLNETVMHIERAFRTYARFKDTLARMPESSVLAAVWNLIVVGYWYALQSQPEIGWPDYRDGYLDSKAPREYVEHLLKASIGGFEVVNDLEPHKEDEKVFQALSHGMLENREHQRNKAQFRDDEMMRERAENDVKMILYLSRRAEKKSGSVYGYLATEDGSFWAAEESDEWGRRSRVSVRTTSIPELAEFCCGEALDDAEFIRLLFESVTVAVGELMQDDIQVLVTIGVDLHTTSPVRLEWNLKNDLRKRIHEFKQAVDAESPDAEEIVVRTLEKSVEIGLPLDSRIAEVVQNYRKMRAESDEYGKLKQSLRDLFYEVAGQSSKGRTRANRVLRGLGMDVKSDKGKSDT